MKLFFFSALFFNMVSGYGQEIYTLNNEFSWTTIEKMDSGLIERFIKQTPAEFEYYKLNEEYNPKIKDLKKALHIADLNNDGLYDVVFDGETGGEPRQIAIFINKDNSFRKVFADYQGILKMEFTNGVLSKINLQDWGCCGGYRIINRFYEVITVNGEFSFKMSKSFQYIDGTILPDKYWEGIKKIMVHNDNYKLRTAPLIDDSTETGYEGDPAIGNSVGKIPKGAIAIALAESVDPTGRVWYFVAVLPEYILKKTFLNDYRDEHPSYKCGWISSRFVEVQE